MEFFDNRYFRVNKFFLKCIGQWPYQNIVEKRLIQAAVISNLLIFSIPMISSLYQEWGNVNLMIELLHPIFTDLGCLIYTIVYICKEKKLKKLFNRIQSDWQLCSSKEDINILSRHAEHGRTYTIIYTGCILGTGITYMIMTLTRQFLDILQPLNETRPKILPYPAEYFVNVDTYYYLIIIHIFFNATIGLAVIIGCDTVLAIFTEHACGLFSILGHRLKVVKNMELTNNNLKSDVKDITYKTIAYCIKQHNRTIEFCDTVESCFCSCFFFTMGLNSILISCSLIQIVAYIDNFDNTVKFGVFTGGLIVHLYFNSLPAQRLMDFSTLLADKLYDGMWYKLPLKSKKLLSMIMMRSNVPCTLTAGKVLVMSMENFCSILQASFSYFTLLTSIRT